jgi:MFS family permease
VGEGATEELTFEQKKKKLFWLGVHMCALRQFTGGNVLLVQGGLFIKKFNPGVGEYTSLIINSVLFVAILVSIGYLQKVIGKRPTFLFSLTAMGILNFVLVGVMASEKIMATLALMCLFLAVFGGSFINQCWAYPSEVIPAREATIPNIVHWLTMSISMLVPPLLSGIMPSGNPYPVFIFFGLYSFVGLLHFYKCMK